MLLTFFTPIEIMALTLIVISLVKLVAVAVAPKKWFGFAQKLMSNPTAATFTYLILAAFFLWVLVNNGVSIVTILAVMLFASFFIAVAFIRYAPDVFRTMDPDKILKGHWLYIILWVAMMVWGIAEIFFK